MAICIALDVGTKTIGVARADTQTRIATPLSTIARKGVRTDVQRLAILCTEQAVETVVVGLPLDLEGNERRSARLARQVGEALAAATGLATVYQDERFSTVEAQRRLREAGVDSRKQKSRIDQAAAAVILQDWLDYGTSNV